ncbi:MAG: hypothetical protein WEC80_01610 [Patescibacteria group bacterium]
MFSDKFSIFLGSETQGTFTSFIVDSGFYLVINLESSKYIGSGHAILKDISDSIKSQSIKNLDDFDNYLASKWKQHNLPSDFSFAAGIAINNLFLLKTKGKGQIFLKKGKNFAKIIEVENRASGNINQDDLFVFTIRSFTALIGGEEKLSTVFDYKDPNEILEAITPILKSKNDQGTIALFLTFVKKEEVIISEAADKKIENNGDKLILKTNMFKDRFTNLKETVRSKFKNRLSKKHTTIIITVIILILLAWSLISGYNRNNVKASEIIREKLNQAEDVSEINLSRAIALIAEAKDDLSDLKSKSRNKNLHEIKELEKLIKDYESKIIKSEDKAHEEFYDFSIENKDAKIHEFYKYEDEVVILDKGGLAYILSLSGKSINSRISDDLKSSSKIAMYDNTVYFLRKDGVYMIGTDDKINKIIEDDDWGTITDIAVFAGNIYLLDTEKSDIYKYIPIESGFSESTSYFKSGQSIGLNNSNSISIDGSLFIGFPENIVKFTSGLRDGFATTYPNESLKITKIYTDSGTDNIFAWSKNTGVVYILSKTGRYEYQITSSILKTASDFVFFEGSIYVSQGSKIYKIELD